MASSIARAGSLPREPQQGDAGDVVSVFSSPTSARLLSQRKGSLAGENSASVDDTPETAARPAKNDDIRTMNMDEIQERLKELDRQPTQDEIDELMAQYVDDSDEGEESDAENSSRAGDCGALGEEDDSGEREDLILKVLVVGNARCGKTSTIRRYVSKDFWEEYSSTIGADFIEKVIDYDQHLRVHLQLWDIAGQDRFAKFTRAYFREAKGALIVCDITRENTIDAVVTWKKEIDVCCKDLNDGESIPVVMVANKSDLLQDPMGALNIGVNMQKCVSNNGIIEWFRASAKSGEHVNEAFQCLLDKLVQDHRDQQQHRSTSSSPADDKNDRRARGGEDVIRLSQYAAPPHSNKSDGGICDCN